MKVPIRQKDNLGCGIACLAFVANRSYEEIVNDLGKEKIKKGLYCREIVQYLKKLGYAKTECHYLKSKWRKKIYQNKTIVFIRSKKYPYGHYLVRYKNFWMDPWINFLKEKEIKNAKAGFRKRLPGTPIYGIFLKEDNRR